MTHRAAIDAALRRWRIDLVHMHGIDFHEYLPAAGVPVLATLHLPPGWYPSEVFSMARPETYLHCVSSSQRRACPPGAALLPDIENGVSLDIFARSEEHTAELQSIIRISSAVFCLKKKTKMRL